MRFLKWNEKTPQHYVVYLRSDVIWGTTERSCGPVTRHAFLTHAKVGQFDVSFVVQ